jgi:hypothetical protein
MLAVKWLEHVAVEQIKRKVNCGTCIIYWVCLVSKDSIVGIACYSGSYLLCIVIGTSWETQNIFVLKCAMHKDAVILKLIHSC